MRPKQTLLLVLAIGSVAFMTFLFCQNLGPKVSCEKCKKEVSKQDSSSGDEMFKGSFNHMIVSTIK